MFTPIDQAIEHFKQNKFVIVMDDASRENEGDLICAAENVSTEQMAFLVRHSSGYVCAPMTNAIADKLDLPLLRTGMKFESNDDDRHGDRVHDYRRRRPGHHYRYLRSRQVDDVQGSGRLQLHAQVVLEARPHLPLESC